MSLDRSELREGARVHELVQYRSESPACLEPARQQPERMRQFGVLMSAATKSRPAADLPEREKNSPRTTLFGSHSGSRRFHCKALPNQIDVSAQVVELV